VGQLGSFLTPRPQMTSPLTSPQGRQERPAGENPPSGRFVRLRERALARAGPISATAKGSIVERCHASRGGLGQAMYRDDWRAAPPLSSAWPELERPSERHRKWTSHASWRCAHVASISGSYVA